jgi:uncharacterized membrane protein YccC
MSSEISGISSLVASYTAQGRQGRLGKNFKKFLNEFDTVLRNSENRREATKKASSEAMAHQVAKAKDMLGQQAAQDQLIETVGRISNMMKAMHDAIMGVINNMR